MAEQLSVGGEVLRQGFRLQAGMERSPHHAWLSKFQIMFSKMKNKVNYDGLGKMKIEIL